jgi:branched-chain amino acid aminotransferase
MLPTVATRAPITPTWTFYEGDWHEGNVAIMGPRTHGAWLCSVVFDGARRMEGGFPDLLAHCERVNRSAVALGLEPQVEVGRWLALVADGARRFAPEAPLYIRPMYWAEAGAAGGGVMFDPASTRWCLCLHEAAFPEPKGVAITLSPFRRPTRESAVVEAKAGSLYPNSGRALREAVGRGFGNCLMLDALGAVAELANANVFMAKDGVVHTPAPNGTFLDGVTRRRVIALLRAAGVEVVERTMVYADFLEADEIFSSGNFQKVAPVSRIEGRELGIGPLTMRTRELYWAFARASG